MDEIIDQVLETMEYIVGWLIAVATEMIEVVKNIFAGLIVIAIFLLAPIWIVPYMIWKARRGRDNG